MFSQVCVHSPRGDPSPQVLSQVLIRGVPQTWVGGTPVLARGCYSSPSWEGNPVPARGVPRGLGYLLWPRQDWGTAQLDRTVYPPSRTGLGYPPIQDRTRISPLARRVMRYPLAQTGITPPPQVRTGLGYPPPSKDSRASTGYMAGGMPLAVTQDFLVLSWFWVILTSKCLLTKCKQSNLIEHLMHCQPILPNWTAYSVSQLQCTLTISEPWTFFLRFHNTLNLIKL